MATVVSQHFRYHGHNLGFFKYFILQILQRLVEKKKLEQILSKKLQFSVSNFNLHD